MTLRIVSGTVNRPLAAAIAAALATDPAPCEVERFPDGELRSVVDDIRGGDVYVVQPTGPPVNENVMELLLIDVFVELVWRIEVSKHTWGTV